MTFVIGIWASFIKKIKSRRMEMFGHLTCISGRRDPYTAPIKMKIKTTLYVRGIAGLRVLITV
jgi:hypothetical protein